jgi:TetR/AcrR family transcriptional regulator, regulator of cefoperazone and chloramphenicol sensitivity
MSDNLKNRLVTGIRTARDTGRVDSVTAEDDLTARVRIRDAALSQFAEEGFDRTTIRAIARTAGVSHGMLRHHFGSKIDLRAACDDYVFQVLHRLNTLLLDAPSPADPSLQISNPLWRYAARSLVDGSPSATPIFDELVAMTARQLAPISDLGTDQASPHTHIYAALVAAMVTAIPLFHTHLSYALGVDIFSPEADTLLSRTLCDMFAVGDHDEVSLAVAVTRSSE